MCVCVCSNAGSGINLSDLFQNSTGRQGQVTLNNENEHELRQGCDREHGFGAGINSEKLIREVEAGAENQVRGTTQHRNMH